MRRPILLGTIMAIATGCSQSGLGPLRTPATSPGETATNVLHINKVEWEQLNPARGDRSPKAATLWGDRNGKDPTGFLVQFVDGFSSPPHIHNVSYRGVVISGLVHNDDPDAAKMWMPPGSFWTQPKGEIHITAAKGDVNVAYIEIEEGPYRVLPIDEAFDSGERPVNVDPSNIVWLDGSDTERITSTSFERPEIAFLWGIPAHGQLHGSFIKLPAGFRGDIQTDGPEFRAVIVKGNLVLEDMAGAVPLAPGSTFNSEGTTVHRLSGGQQAECILYVRTSGTFNIKQQQ